MEIYSIATHSKIIFIDKTHVSTPQRKKWEMSQTKIKIIYG